MKVFFELEHKEKIRENIWWAKVTQPVLKRVNNQFLTPPKFRLEHEFNINFSYIIGPEEELPRKMEFFTFVMHAPDDYFFYKSAPYPTLSISTDQEYVVTRAGPKVRLLKDGKAMYKDMMQSFN